MSRNGDKRPTRSRAWSRPHTKKRWWRVIAAAAVLGCAVMALRSPHTMDIARGIAAYAAAASPSDVYAARVRLQLTAQSLPGMSAVLASTRVAAIDPAAGHAWLQARDRAVAAASRVTPPFEVSGRFAGPDAAAAWRFTARRGHRVTVVVSSIRDVRPFVDVENGAGTRLASAAAGVAQLTYDVAEAGDLVLRVQPPLGASGEYRVSQTSGPSVVFPVQGVTPRAIQSVFGAQRDAGQRLHEGIDIFAPRGTPVVAATDGWIGNALTNGLGGNVIWVWNPLAGMNTYYAHLDRHAARPGQRVSAGEVVGYVGNTGNARGGPTHLHFGIYVSGEGSVDPVPFVCGVTCLPARPILHRGSSGRGRP